MISCYKLCTVTGRCASDLRNALFHSVINIIYIAETGDADNITFSCWDDSVIYMMLTCICWQCGIKFNTNELGTHIA